MFGSDILDVTVGLFLVYLVFSAVCTAINEAIAGFLRLRGRLLYAEIGRLFGDTGLAERFWACGLTRSLCRVNGDADVSAKTAPSYMPAQVFAASAIEAMKSLDGDADRSGADNPSAHLACLIERIDDRSIFKASLVSLANDAKVEIDDLETRLERWFSQIMDRTSGVYKRNLQLVSFLVAVVLVSAFNIDTVSVSRSLWNDREMRAAFVSIAEQVVEDGGMINLDTGEDGVMASIKGAHKMLQPMPFGWSQDPFVTNRDQQKWQDYLLKLFGLLTTAFALTLGAPFWFDTLSRIMNARSAGPESDANGKSELVKNK